MRGVEVKAHKDWPAPSDVHIRGHESFRDVRSFDLRHIDHHLVRDPWSETARCDVSGLHIPGTRL